MYNGLAIQGIDIRLCRVAVVVQQRKELRLGHGVEKGPGAELFQQRLVSAEDASREKEAEVDGRSSLALGYAVLREGVFECVARGVVGLASVADDGGDGGEEHKNSMPSGSKECKFQDSWIFGSVDSCHDSKVMPSNMPSRRTIDD